MDQNERAKLIRRLLRRAAAQKKGLAWHNEETQAAFEEVFREWSDIDGAAKAFIEQCGERAGPEFAMQIHNDFHKAFGTDTGNKFMNVLLRLGMERVNFRQIADRLLAKLQPRKEG
jgi:hypothetical protein